MHDTLTAKADHKKQAMPKIERDLAFEMMRAGKKDADIAAHFGTSRQAVNLLRKSLAAQGKLEDPTTKTGGTPEIPQAVHGGDSSKGATFAVGPTAQEDPTYEQITAWITRTIDQAAQLPQLRRELREALERLEGLQLDIHWLRQQLEQANKDRASVMAKAAEFQQAVDRLRASRLAQDQ